jgi:catechol 2,3-dioxygenase-like lactoylglutathione lyase family enzyme
MGIAKLGHVGIHCNDLQATKAFYRDILGLTVTDEDAEAGMVFLSSQPELEHHELVLVGGRNVPPDALMVQQISFRCNDLADVLEYFERFKARKVVFDMVVTHGNAIGIYFYDPEGNRCEVYWPTGLTARQPFLDAIDLEKSPDAILARVRELVDKYGATGYVDTSMLAAQNIH